MLKLILKNLWARRVRNAWLLAELILVTVLTWYITDPLFLLIFGLFIFKTVLHSELYGAFAALAVLIPYYYIIWLNRTRLKQKFSFTIKPINN